MARRRNTPITASVSSGAAFVFTASISGGAGNGINGMLRKEFYVVRKKYHVVRKLFYVASIFGGAAGRRNRPPWELSSTASRRRQRLQCVYRAPVFSRGAHTSLPDTNRFLSTLPLPSARRRVFFLRPALQKLFSGLKIACGTMRARKPFIHNGHTVQPGTMGTRGLAAAQPTRTTSALFHTTSRRPCARKHILLR